MPIQMALRPKARICGAYPVIGYGRINVFGHSLSLSDFREFLDNSFDAMFSFHCVT